MKYSLLAIIAMATLFVSCKKENLQPEKQTKNFIKIGTSLLSDGYAVTLYSTDSLKTGFCEILFDLERDGKPLSAADIKMTTLMDMGTMKHSSPSTTPLFDQETKMFKGGAVFTMAGAWQLVTKINGEEKIFDIDVTNSATKLVGNYTGADGKGYVVSLMPGKKFSVGLNDFGIYISKKLSMMEFVDADNLQVEFYPEMPSMGHSSPNNVNPSFVGNGMYRGKVNFTMTGDWRFHFKIYSGETLIVSDATLDIVF